jgi:hypothetical protein
MRIVTIAAVLTAIVELGILVAVNHHNSALTAALHEAEQTRTDLVRELEMNDKKREAEVHSLDSEILRLQRELAQTNPMVQLAETNSFPVPPQTNWPAIGVTTNDVNLEQLMITSASPEFAAVWISFSGRMANFLDHARQIEQPIVFGKQLTWQDMVLSRSGTNKGVVLRFTNRSDAEAFASKLYKLLKD